MKGATYLLEHLLNTRGEFETIFLGALTIKPLLIKIFPDIKFELRKDFLNLVIIQIEVFLNLNLDQQ